MLDLKERSSVKGLLASMNLTICLVSFRSLFILAIVVSLCCSLMVCFTPVNSSNALFTSAEIRNNLWFRYSKTAHAHNGGYGLAQKFIEMRPLRVPTNPCIGSCLAQDKFELNFVF